MDRNYDACVGFDAAVMSLHFWTKVPTRSMGARQLSDGLEPSPSDLGEGQTTTVDSG
jgi:hypothetical protein